MSDPDAGGQEPPDDAESTDDRADPGDLQVRTDDGRTIYVAPDEGETGSEGPFLVAYLSPDRDRRYGWLCTSCDTFDNAMDSMGRIECNVCGNFRKPTEWDAAHE